MNRDHSIQQLERATQWDVAIIGGGATGLGIALDAASRGLKTVLFEKNDFASGTSSKSTKLVHGGVRYLQQGNIRLVTEALRERGLLLKNAPHLVHNQKFVVPNYKWWEKPFYGIGLKIYDKMAGRLGLGPSEWLSREETIKLVPTLDPHELKGGVLYHDGQFDDARLALSIAITATRHNAVLVNYCAITSIIKKDNRITGVIVTDSIHNRELEIHASCIINATGVYTDSILDMDNTSHEKIVSPSQGIHIVVDRSFLPGDTAIMIPRTDDGRVLFAVPWHDKIVLGTTDTPVTTIDEHPVPQANEIEFVLQHISRYLTKDPAIEDIRSTFAGLRPLIKGKAKRTASLSRDHLIEVSPSGLITVSGGKWTTYRKMAQDAVDIAITQTGIDAKPCTTESILLDGHDSPAPVFSIANTNDNELRQLVQYAITNEMCMTIEDFLSRRTRQLLLDARIAIEKAPLVAKLMAEVMDQPPAWIDEQIIIFNRIAKTYLPF